MDYKHTINILSENIKELDAMVSGFASYEKIPVLEMDLVLDKTRNLYEVLLLLKKSATDNQPESALSQKSAGHEHLKTEFPIHTGAEPDVISDNPEKVHDKKSTAVDPDSLQDSADKIPSDQNKPVTLSDRFKKQSTSINENLVQSKPLYDVSSRLQTKPIANISNAIGLNDKFLFINELFDGNTEEYNKTIDLLNNAIDFNEAYNFLIGNFKWDMKSDTVQKILELVRRKLIVKKDE